MMRTVILATLLFACGAPPEPGPAGPPGPQGPTGSQGSPGTGLVTTSTCVGEANFSPTLVSVVYHRYDFADGSSYVTCSVFPENGPLAEKVGTPAFIKASDPDVALGPCIVFHDMATVDGDGAGKFTLTLQRGASGSGVGQALYQDAGPFDQARFPMECNAET